MDPNENITRVDLNELEARLSKYISELLIKISSKEVLYIKSSEVRRLLSCSASTLQNYRNSGKLPFSRIGGAILYNYYDILRIIEQSKVQIEPIKRKSRKKYELVDEWNTET